MRCLAALPLPLPLSGAKGPNASEINGVYVPVDELYNDHVLYQKRSDPDWYLCYVKQGDYWMVSGNTDKAENNLVGWAHSAETELPLPTLAKTWKEWDGESWAVTPALSVVQGMAVVISGAVPSPRARRRLNGTPPVAPALPQTLPSASSHPLPLSEGGSAALSHLRVRGPHRPQAYRCASAQ